MASSIRSHRVSIAAGVLTLALVAPAVTVPDSPFAVFAVAQTVATSAADFDDRYEAENFWGKTTASVEGLKLKAGDQIAPTGLNTVFRWGVSADSDGTIEVTRPRDLGTFNRAKNASQADIGVRVTPQNGSPYNTTLRITVTDVDPGPSPEEQAHRAKFTQRYKTENFWGVDEAKVEGLQLEPGDQVAPRDLQTIFRWGVRANDDGTVTVTRPESAAAYGTGDRDINVRVTPANGAAYDAVLQLDVVDSEPALTDEEKAARGQFDQRYDTANFWNKQTAQVPELKLQPGDQIAPRDAATIFRWGVAADDQGVVTVTRPQSPTTYGTGNRDINVRVTPANGRPFDAVLKLNVIDQREAKEWEQQLATRYPLDFEKSTSAKPVTEITLPDGVSVSKNGAALPTGWSVSNDGNTIRVTPPSTFKEGDFDLPIRVNDGTDQFEKTLKISAKNPQQTPAETAGTVAGILGPLLGSILGGGGGLLGGLLGGGGNGGGTGGAGGAGGEGGGAGRLINVVITNNANPSNIGNNNGSPNVIITDNANPRDNLSNNGSNNSAVVTGNANPVITGNANPNVEVKDNLSNNGNPVITNNANPTVVITGNANPVITGNANPNVEIKDNASNNGSNNSAVITNNANPVITGNANPVITNNANPVITGNANDNGSNNSAVVTGNANPVVTGNANNNGSNNSAVVTGNANPTVVITGNANPVITGNANPTVDIKDNLSNNGNPVITNNANPVITDNANNNGNPVITGNANPVITGNANPVITGNANNNGNPNVEVKDNANPQVSGVPLPGSSSSSEGGSSKKDKGGDGDGAGTGDGGQGDGGSSNGGSSEGGSSLGGSSVGANVQATGGLSDPRCVAALAGLGIPLLALIPVALAQATGTPGLDQAAAQAAAIFDEAARQFGVRPTDVTAVAGGVVGVVLATVVAIALATCIPNVNSVDITVGGKKNADAPLPTEPKTPSEPAAQ